MNNVLNYTICSKMPYDLVKTVVSDAAPIFH